MLFDAITTQRPYHDAQPEEKALSVSRHEVDIGWRRRELVDALTALVSEGQLGDEER